MLVIINANQSLIHAQAAEHDIWNYILLHMTVFQLGIFLGVLPILSWVLTDLHSALPELKVFLFFFLQYSRCKNACIFVPMFSSFPHKIVFRLRFVRVLDCDKILVIRALNCARFCVVCALNCAQILVVRARLCPISFVPCPFPTPKLVNW